MSQSYSGDEIHSTQRTTLILICHTFFLAINEILKEQTKQKTQNPIKRNLSAILYTKHRTQTILFKPFLCALLKSCFQHTTFYFHQILYLGTLQYSYRKSIISLNFIMLIILIYHSSKSWFFH